jgi:hypothetical protein
MPESKDLSSAVTVWSSLPLFCHTTVVPAGTVSSAGSKCHLVRSGSLSTISTRVPSAAGAGADGPKSTRPVAIANTAASGHFVLRIPPLWDEKGAEKPSGPAADKASSHNVSSLFKRG